MRIVRFSIWFTSLCPGLLAALLLALPGCGEDRARRAVPLDAGPVAVSDAMPPPDAAPPFAADVRSLRLKRSIAVRAAPAEDAARIGTVARDIRVGWRRAMEGEGCSMRWIEIEPYGWVCERYVEPSEELPYGVEVPRLERGEIVPGVYGKVIAKSAMTYVRPQDEGGGQGDGQGDVRLVPHRLLEGSVMVRRYGEITAVPAAPAMPDAGVMEPGPGGAAGASEADTATAAAAPGQVDAGASAGTRLALVPGKPTAFWLIDKKKRGGEYLPAKHIREFVPSSFQGTRLGDETGLTLPMGFPLSRRRVSDAVAVYDAATGGQILRKIPSRVPVPVLETASDAAGAAVAYRIGEGQWVRASDLRLAAKTEPPQLTGALERWIDIDLDQQVLVAYEGTLPVYATLVSTGTRKTPTETGVYRIWVKFAETDMKDLGGESPYSVATVPWTQFYAKDLALHTAYWHDTFGTPRSHGCTNLSPGDARFLYFWSDPQVPPGWSMANGSVDMPGSVVRVRSKQDPAPELRGYAKRVYEARLARRDGQAAVGH